MSGDSWLFLFAAIGAIGGIAQVASLYFQIRPLPAPHRDESIPDGASVSEVPLVMSQSGVFVSKSRLAGIGVVMLISASLAGLGFWRSLSQTTPIAKPDDIIATSAVTGWGTDIDPVSQKPLDNFGKLELAVVSVGPKSKDYKIVLLARAENNLVDPMRDPHLDHSVAFIIVPGQHNLQVALSEATKSQLRVTHMLFLYLVALPNEHSPEDLTSLFTIDSLKAKIMAQQAVLVP